MMIDLIETIILPLPAFRKQISCLGAAIGQQTVNVESHRMAPSEKRGIAVPMTSADRRRVRRKLDLPEGPEIALELPTGSILHAGQVLFESETSVWIVAAADEEVLIVTPASIPEAARAAHFIGNLHRDIDVQGDSIVALWDMGLEQRLLKGGFASQRDRRPFGGAPLSGHAH